MRKLKIAAFGLTGILAMTACGGPNTTAYSATGTWTGSSTNINNENIVSYQQLVLTDNAGTITGDWYVKTSSGEYVKLGAISGTRDANNYATLNMTMTAAGGTGTATFKGTFNGNIFSGNYSASGGGAGPFNFTR